MKTLTLYLMVYVLYLGKFRFLVLYGSVPFIQFETRSTEN